MKKTRLLNDEFVVIEGFCSPSIYQIMENGDLKKVEIFKSGDLVLSDEFTKVYLTRTENGKILVYAGEVFGLKIMAFQRVVSRLWDEIILETAEGEIWQAAIEGLEEGIRETTFRFHKK